MYSILVVLKVLSPINNISITWERVRNADYQDLPRPIELEMLGVGPNSLSLLNSSGDSEARVKNCESLVTHSLSKFESTLSLKKHSDTYVSSEKGLIPNFLTVESLQKKNHHNVNGLSSQGTA